MLQHDIDGPPTFAERADDLIEVLRTVERTRRDGSWGAPGAAVIDRWQLEQLLECDAWRVELVVMYAYGVGMLTHATWLDLPGGGATLVAHFAGGDHDDDL